MDDVEVAMRREAVRRRLGGESPRAIARDLGRTRQWVAKWAARYDPHDPGWAEGRSRAPKRVAHLQHPRLDIHVSAVRDALGSTRAALRPARIVRVIARRPLRYPLPRATQIARDRARRLAAQPTAHRLTPHRHLNVIHPDLLRSINTSTAGSAPTRMATISWRLNPQPRKRCAGGQR